ncbi:hypothetical protein HMPREF3185_01092 [Porphyromonas somerae]|uniref:Uncharacterized protein n=1 Tax=Porphyromonas somerae TaxID=322095 RepID=A0A134B886_9PORP|nr:hypothetical protein HMPREF3184_01092 [Porphyromonadaceae bacterium KA00676]KXB76155.1 hypothetical protein HMPREF3185_01092 [Porphyromonas somerae]
MQEKGKQSPEMWMPSTRLRPKPSYKREVTCEYPVGRKRKASG